MSLPDQDNQFIWLLLQYTSVIGLVAGIGLILLLYTLPKLSGKQVIALGCWMLLGAAGLIYLQSTAGGLNILFGLAFVINAGVWAFSGLIWEDR